MQNYQNFDINKTIDEISNYSPVLLFIMMLLMFAMTGWLQYSFLLGVFSDVIPGANYLSFLFPIVIQVLRLVTGFLSASFLKKRKFFLGIIVLLFSIWLSAFEYNTIDDMTKFWTGVSIDLSAVVQADLKVEISKNVIEGVMTVLIWGAMVLEFFLAGWMATISSSKKDDLKTSNTISHKSGNAKKLKSASA